MAEARPDIAATVLRIAQHALTAERATDKDRALRDILAAVAGLHLAGATPAERMAREAERLLAEYDRLGGGRDAASRAARNLAIDRRDTLEVERLAQRIRALARRRNKAKPLRSDS